MRVRLMFALLAATSFVLCGQTGAVKSEGQPLPGATVRATQGDRVLTTLTDARGEFRFDNLTPGMWTIDVAMFGFQPGHREVQLGTTPIKMDFNMELAPFPVGFGRGGGGFGRGGGGGFNRGGGGFNRGGGETGQNRNFGGGGRQQNNGAPAGNQPNSEPGGFAQRSSANEAQQEAENNANPFDTSSNGVAESGAGFTGQVGQTDANVASSTLAGVDASGANESFLVNGSLSGALQTQPGDFVPGGPGTFQGGPGGLNAGLGAQVVGQATIPGQGPGAIAGGGGFGGGAFGGGGFGGGRGGFGPGGFGPGGRGRRGAFGRGGGFIGNRRNRGQNQIRGSLFYTGSNSDFNAAPFSLTGETGTKSYYAQNKFGFNLGGPFEFPKLFRSENTFFTINYNGNLSQNGNNLVSTVPTLAERSGDFSALSTTLYNPLTNQPLQGNRITQINPIAQGLLAFIPIANQPGTVNNYRLVQSVPNHSQNMNIRVNQTLDRSDQLSFGVSWQTRTAETLQSFGYLDHAKGDGINATFNYRHTFGTNKFNSLTGTMNRNTNTTNPYFANGTNVAAELGIQGTSPNPINFGPPALTFTNFTGLSDGSPSQSAIYNVGVSDTFSIRHGKHNWSMGGGYNRYFNNTITDANGRGTFTFTGLATSQINSVGQPVAGTGLDFADFLLGSPESNSVRYNGSDTYFRSNAFNAFILDDYRVRNNLTLNLGVRYEYFSPWHEKYGRIANLDLAPGFTAATVVTPALPGQPNGLIKPDRDNFAPRTSLAWKPNIKKSLVVRIGYGIYYNPSIYNQFESRLSAQPPFATSTNVVTSVDNPLSLATGLTVTPDGKTILNTFAVNPNYRDMYAQTWNVSVQSDLPGSLVGEISYLGTKGTRLDIQEAPNQAPPGAILTAEQRTAIGNATGFIYDTPVGNSIYHAGQLRLTRRFRRNLSGNLLYTYAKSIDDSSTLGGAGNTVAQNFNDLSAERGLSSFDRRNTFTANFVAGSPVGGASGFLANHTIWTAALRDWTLNPSFTLETGTPLTARVLGNQSDIAGTGNLGSGRADATGLPVETGSGFFNLAAFTAPPAGQFGDAGRNTIPGPGLFTMNLSLQRTIILAERKRLQIRIDTANITNHVNITGFGTVVNSINYGVATGAGGMRTLSMTVRFNF